MTNNIQNYDKWYSKFAPKVLGQSDQNCVVCGQFSVFKATSKSSYRGPKCVGTSAAMRESLCLSANLLKFCWEPIFIIELK